MCRSGNDAVLFCINVVTGDVLDVMQVFRESIHTLLSSLKTEL